MRPRRALPLPLERALRGFFHYKLLTLAVNLLTFEVLRPRAGAAWPRVSLLVPARDEAHNLARTLPALLAQGAHEVIVLDDHSSDGSAALAAGLGARVVRGAALPPGWLGKTWACQQLGQAATGDVLVFTDADVLWNAGALSAVVHTLLRSRADLLTVWPRQEVGSLGERLIVPLNDDVLLSLLPAPMVGLPFAAAAAGNGQLMAFWRGPYERLGGHAIVRGEVLEDVVFAARLKARGGRLAIALGGNLVGVRMYRDYPEVVQGFAKSLPGAHANQKLLLGASWGWHLLAYTWPWLAGRWEFVVYALLERLLVNLKTGRRAPADVLEVLAVPLVPLAALPIYLRALRGRYSWKGRTYERQGAKGTAKSGPAAIWARGEPRADAAQVREEMCEEVSA